MRRVSSLVLAAAMLATIPATAWSQPYVTPFLGFNYGGDSIDCLSLRDCNDKAKNFGVSIGKTNGIFGIEQDISYVPHFFGDVPGEGHSMLTLMSSLLLIAPLGPVEPYGLLGIGLMRPNTVGGAKNALAYNIGAGVMVFPSSRFGVRADLRRMRSMSDFTLFIFSGVKLEFWRASIGVTLR